MSLMFEMSTSHKFHTTNHVITMAISGVEKFLREYFNHCNYEKKEREREERSRYRAQLRHTRLDQFTRCETRGPHKRGEEP